MKYTLSIHSAIPMEMRYRQHLESIENILKFILINFNILTFFKKHFNYPNKIVIEIQGYIQFSDRQLSKIFKETSVKIFN